MRYVPKVPTPTSRTRSRGGNNNRNQYFAAIENCFNSSSFFFFCFCCFYFPLWFFHLFPSRPNTPGSYAWASASKCAPHLRHVISDWRSESTPQTLFCPFASLQSVTSVRLRAKIRTAQNISLYACASPLPPGVFIRTDGVRTSAY